MLIGIESTGPAVTWSCRDSLEELDRLVVTAGGVVLGLVTQQLREPVALTYVGKGKVDELRERVDALAIELVVADDELTPGQQRALETALGVEVLDRTAIILDIFAQHAHTKEGALQVELAQLHYRLPRLAGHGRGLSRMGGGIGSRGPGETQLESDRRRIRSRISSLRRELKSVRDHRSVQRRWRRRQGVPVVAIVGYTNAGKSSLLNSLTAANVVTEDLLFATLDTTTRTMPLPNRQQAMITDTVGFIQKLPTDLVNAFQATLEEVTEADVLLHVVDIASPFALEQALTVYEVLARLGAGEKEVVTALNKCDLVDSDDIADYLEDFPHAVPTSTITTNGIDDLRAMLAEVIAGDFIEIEVLLPYEANELLDLYRLRGAIEAEEHRPAGVYLKGRLPQELVSAYAPYKV